MSSVATGARRPRGGAKLVFAAAAACWACLGGPADGFVGPSAWREAASRDLRLGALGAAASPRSAVALLARRREALLAATLPAVAGLDTLVQPAEAAGETVFVAGATGNTGARVVRELQKQGYKVVAGARNLEKAKKTFGATGPELVEFDVEKLDADAMAKAIGGAKLLICATGFVPGNPFTMSAAAKSVDKEGTIKLVDAAKKAGVQKFVLVTSILTNGRAIGQENNPGFVITNAFGGILDEKLVAEKYLRASGLDYTILRPGGLKDAAPEGGAVIGGEDQLLSGEVSRDLVAQVAVESITKAGARNKVVELIEEGSCLGNVQQCDALPKGQSDSSKWFA